MTRILLVTCLVISLTSSFQTNDASWQPVYENGLELLNDSLFTEAEELFKSLLKKDKNIPEVHYGLGLVYDIQNPGSRKAIKEFKKAIKLNPDFVDAYYQLSLAYEKTAGNRFLNLRDAESILRKLIKRDPFYLEAWYRLADLRVRTSASVTGIQKDDELFDEMVKALTSRIKDQPFKDELYAFFLNDAFRYSFEDKIIPILKILIKEFPEHPVYQLDLAYLYLSTGKYQMSLSQLAGIENTVPEQLMCKMALLQAKNHFQLNQDDTGYTYYLKSLSRAQDSSAADLFFYDIWYIMTDNEYKQAKSISPEVTGEFYRRFWASRDPNHATELNERIPEHYRRLHKAVRNYRRIGGEKRWLTLYHQRRSIWSELIPMAYLSAGDELLSELGIDIHEGRFLDDMGLIYIRHGEPEQTASAVGFTYDPLHDVDPQFTIGIAKTIADGRNVDLDMIEFSAPLNMSWKYNATPNRPQLIFHFVKHNDLVGWQLE